jgi:hypothetical protein
LEVYIDGAYHPNKMAENTSRKMRRDIARDEFLAIAATKDASLIPEMESKMVSACFIREDLVFNLKKWCNDHEISIFSAPFECDPQLVEGELGLQHLSSSIEPIFKAIYTVDSDIFALGSATVVDNLSSSNSSCNIIRREKVFESGKLCNFDGSPYDMSVYSAFVGCDFINHPNLQSVHNVQNVLMPKWIAAHGDPELENQILSEISTTRKWKRIDLNTCLDYAEKFHTAKNMFRHPPVFKFDPALLGTGGVVLAPLNLWSNSKSWEELISFNPFETLQDIYESENPGEKLTPNIMGMMYRLSIWARTGRPLQNIPLQTFEGKVVPFGSILDFSIIPIEMQSDDALILWLQFRKLHFKSIVSSRVERLALEAVVKRCDALGNHGPPIIEVSNSVGNGLYIMWNTLKPSNVNVPVDWISNGNEVINLIRMVMPDFNEAYVSEIFGTQRNGVRHRAKKCIFGGCIDLKTMKMCMLKKKENECDVWLITVKVTPSMKSKDIYWTTIVVDLETKSFCQTPYSGCDCPAGQMFCSHMLAVVLLLGIIQVNADESFNDIYETLPKPILDMQSLPVKMTYIY